MIDHVGIPVANLEASIRFYEKALAALGYAKSYADAQSAGFGIGDTIALYLYEKAGGGAHLAFRAETREQVDAFFAAAQENGGTDNGAPGIREDYASNYYAAFARDPDGHNIEVVCFTKD